MEFDGKIEFLSFRFKGEMLIAAAAKAQANISVWREINREQQCMDCDFNYPQPDWA
jgi:hypothetical protein